MRLSTVMQIFIATLLTSQLNSIELKTYYQDGYPKYYKEDSQYKGLCIEIMKLIESKSQNITFKAPDRLVKFKRIKNDLLNGKIDLFFGMTRTKKRESQYTYIDPALYEVNHVIATKKGDNVNVKNFNDIKNLGKNGLILTNQGTSTERFLKKQNGLRVDSSAHNLSANLKKLANDRGRFVYFHDLGMVSTIKKENLQTKLKIEPASFKKYSHYLAFSKSAPKEAVKEVKRIMSEIAKSGELREITDKYFHID